MNEKLRVADLFCGIGTAEQALKELGIEFETVATAEIDRFANQSYEALHGKVNNLGDITKITELPECDLLMFSAPCQSISLAGKQEGIEEGSGTRSSLLWEVKRLLFRAQELGWLPQYLVMENVKALVGKRFKPYFDAWIEVLNGLGYRTYWKVLNTRDYCIPQNRERVFCVSIRGEHEPFVFPEKRILRLRLKDMLDTEVDEKFYLSERALKSLGHSTYNQEKFRMQPLDGVHRTCCSRDYKSPTCVQVGTLSGGKWDKMQEMSRRVYDPDGTSPTVHCAMGGNTHIKIVDDTYPNREPREHTDVSPAIRAERYGFKVVSGQFRPIDRDYNRHGGERIEQFEARKDDVSNALLTGANKNCVQITAGKIQPANPCYKEDGEQRCAQTEFRDDDLSGTVIAGNENHYVKIVAMRGRNPGNPSDRTAGINTEQRLEPNEKGLCNTLTSVQKDNLVLETQVLTRKRTEYGKKIRKAYESGEIAESRRNMTELMPRTDGVANTLTTVTGDSLLAEAPYITPEDAETSKCVRAGGHGLHYGHTWDVIGVKEPTILAPNNFAHKAGDGTATRKRTEIDFCPALQATTGTTQGSFVKEPIEESYRIRKLCPWECLRLQGWCDREINKIRVSGVSNAQIYRQAGNGITATVLIAIFGELFHVPYAEILDAWGWSNE